MLDLQGLTNRTGTVTSVGKRIAVQYNDNQKLKTCFLNATTQFVGAIDDRLAIKSLREGLTVNVWLRKGSTIARYASPNWC